MADEPTIKAIPTKYRGHTFRSRLEARWAVFFTEMRIPWEYEHEGFQLPHYTYDSNGHSTGRETVWYLPDFWIPSWAAFVEIKPRGPISEEAWDKASLLSHHSKKMALIIAGNPWPDEYEIWCTDLMDAGDDRPPVRFAQSDYDGRLWLRSVSRDKDWGVCLDEARCPWQFYHGHLMYDYTEDAWTALQSAFEAARSAKFEGMK